jgi:hypothetical protein
MSEEITPEFAQFLAWEAISRDVVTVKAVYIDMADGDHAAGIFLSQLVYWYLKPDKNGRRRTRIYRDNNWWVAKSRDEWYEEIRLKPRQYDRVAKKLKCLGLIDTASYKFSGRPIAHVRIVISKFMEVWQELAEVDLSGLPDVVKSTSPNGEVHIQRLTQDQDFTSDEVKSKDVDIEEKAPCDDCCEACGRTDEYAKKLPVEIDPKQRCAWCFVLDGWTHIMSRWNDKPANKAHKKSTPRRSGTSTSEKLRKQARTRMTEDEFKEQWVYALERAVRTKHLMVERWFTLEFFLRNDASVSRIATGEFDGFDKQRYEHSHNQLLSWLAHKEAGLAGEPQPAASWTPFGGN